VLFKNIDLGNGLAIQHTTGPLGSILWFAIRYINPSIRSEGKFSASIY